MTADKSPKDIHDAETRPPSLLPSEQSSGIFGAETRAPSLAAGEPARGIFNAETVPPAGRPREGSGERTSLPDLPRPAGQLGLGDAPLQMRTVHDGTTIVGTRPASDAASNGESHAGGLCDESFADEDEDQTQIHSGIPKNIGRFEVVARLGEGAMGEVFKAIDPTTGQEVAIKRLLASAIAVSGNPQQFRLNFIREARRLKSCEHANIVRVLFIGDASADQSGSEPYYVMEYCSGGSLRDVSGGKSPPERIVEIGIKIAGALVLLGARRGIVHRDIKPANVLLRADGEPVLADFGIVHSLADSSILRATSAGTPRFMAPEVAFGDVGSAQSDIYSLGATLYNLASGHAPYAGESSEQILNQIRSSAPPPLSQIARDFPPSVAAVIDCMMAREPRDRYVQARDVVEDFERIRRGELPICVGAPSKVVPETAAPVVVGAGPPLPAIAAPAPSVLPQPAVARRSSVAAYVAALVALVPAIVVPVAVYLAWPKTPEPTPTPVVVDPPSEGPTAPGNAESDSQPVKPEGGGQPPRPDGGGGPVIVNGGDQPEPREIPAPPPPPAPSVFTFITESNLAEFRMLVASTPLKELESMVDSDGLNPLHFALEQGRVDFANLLLDARDAEGGGFDVCKTDARGRTAAHIAVLNLRNAKALFEKLLKRSADGGCLAAEYGAQGETVFAAAMAKGQANVEAVQVLRAILERDPEAWPDVTKRTNWLAQVKADPMVRGGSTG